MIQVKKAETNDELLGILSLQKRNFKQNLTKEEVQDEGFVTVNHDIETLQLMNSYESQILAVEDDIVIGYALVMVRQMENRIPVLKPMFEILNGLSYGSKKISESQFYIMGQVCIDKSHRGKGLFKKLFDVHKSEFKSKYDYCITEVSESNPRSLRAHEKVGFENIHSYSDVTDDWNILLLKLN